MFKREFQSVLLLMKIQEVICFNIVYKSKCELDNYYVNIAYCNVCNFPLTVIIKMYTKYDKKYIRNQCNVNVVTFFFHTFFGFSLYFLKKLIYGKL